MTSENTNSYIENLLDGYSKLRNSNKKIDFVKKIKQEFLNPCFYENLGNAAHKNSLKIILKLCVCEATQNEILEMKSNNECELTKDLQIVLDCLLKSKSPNLILINLLQLLADEIPSNFEKELKKEQKSVSRIILKCMNRITQNFTIEDNIDVKIFDILLELYKFFKQHPPENLEENLPSIKDLEFIFKCLKQFCDFIYDSFPNKSKEFLDFIKRKDNSNVFLEYLNAFLEKKYPDIIMS